jgi:hypothetical protein
MRTTTYCYPWDLARLGVADTLQEIADYGIAAVDLAANYHPIDSLSPRGGLNLFSDARGAVYFPARTQGYGRIKPHICPDGTVQTWPEAANAAARIGLGLNSWTITLFQPWIRDAYPDCARVLPWGSPSGSGVCAASPDVVAYVTQLCVDLSEQFGVELFRLEGVLSHNFDLDWLRPRSLIEMSPLSRTLSNLCFCNSCKARGTGAGIDVTALQARVVAGIEAEIVGGPGGERRLATFAGDAELIAFAESQVMASVELVRAVSSRVGHAAQVSCNAITPYRALIGPERDDALLRAFIAAGSQVDLVVLNPVGNRLVSGLNAAMESPRPLSALYVTVRNPTVTSSVQMAESGADKMLANLQAAVDVGVRQIALYNYGLMPDVDVEVFMATIGQLTLP